jgi:5'-nucleotidase
MPRVRVLLSLLIGVCLLSSTVASQPKPYRILVCNDDGARAPGILAVARALKGLGEVLVVAPADNQSGKGHSITIGKPIMREDLMLEEGINAVSLTATPVSTMKVALKNIVSQRPDLVVSGINRGYNLGTSAYLSGTVGAAREAAIAGIPAIAASLATPAATDYTAAAGVTLKIARYVKGRGLPRGVFLNVNIPGTFTATRLTSQAPSSGGSETFEELRDAQGRTFYKNTFVEGGTDSEGTDTWAVAHGFVAVTPLHATEYDAKATKQLKGLTK